MKEKIFPACALILILSIAFLLSGSLEASVGAVIIAVLLIFFSLLIEGE